MAALVAGRPAPAVQPEPVPAAPPGVETARHRGYPAVELGSLAGPVFTGTSVHGSEAVARVGSERFSLRAGSPFVRHGNAVFQLATPAYLEDGRFWVPLDLLSERHPVSRAGRAGTASPAAAAGPSPAVPRSGTVAGEILPARRAGPWRVVIDAGHGGHDPGTVNRRTGAREKDITLAVARRLHDLLDRRPEFEPILTRGDDRFLKLAERSRIATASGADLFLSLHVNAQERGSGATGFETYFLSQARTEESKRVAIRENSVLELEGESDPQTLGALQYILAGLEQSGNVREASRFAGFVQNEMRRELTSDDRGVKQAGFYVLMGATGSMPAVLVEMGFLTNGAEERVLRSGDGQQKIALSLERAIASYFEEVDRRLQRLSAAGEE